MPHCDLQMVGFAFYKEIFIFVEKYENLASMWDLHFPLVVYCFIFEIFVLKGK